MFPGPLRTTLTAQFRLAEFDLASNIQVHVRASELRRRVLAA